MKKCNRCNNVIDWDRSFCPLCGGQVTDIPRPVRESIAETAPAVVESIGIPEIVAPPNISATPSPSEMPSPPAPLPSMPPSPPAPQLPPANIADLPPPPASPIQATAMISTIPSPAPPIPSPIPAVSPPPVVPVPPAASVFDDFQIPTQATAGKTVAPPDIATPFAGSISQIHQPPVPTVPTVPTVPPVPPVVRSEAPPFGINVQENPMSALLQSGNQPQAEPLPETRADDAYTPLDTLLREEKVVSHNVGAGTLDDQFADIFRRITPNTDEPEIQYPTDDPIEALLKTDPKSDIDDGSGGIGDASLFLSVGDSDKGSSDVNVIPNLPDDVKPNPYGDNSQDDFLRMFPRAKG